MSPSPFGDWDADDAEAMELADQGWAGDTWPEPQGPSEYALLRDDVQMGVKQETCTMCGGRGWITVTL